MTIVNDACTINVLHLSLYPELALSITIISDAPNCGVTYDNHYDDRNSFMIQARDPFKFIYLIPSLKSFRRPWNAFNDDDGATMICFWLGCTGVKLGPASVVGKCPHFSHWLILSHRFERITRCKLTKYLNQPFVRNWSYAASL